jgi:hypothetical protein
MSRTTEINDKWWDYVSVSDIADMSNAARERANMHYRERCEYVAVVNANNRQKQVIESQGGPPAPPVLNIPMPKPLPAFNVSRHSIANTPCALCGQKLNCFSKFLSKKAPQSFVCIDVERGMKCGLHPKLELMYSTSMLKCLGVTVLKHGSDLSENQNAVLSMEDDPQLVSLGGQHKRMRPERLPTFAHEMCMEGLSKKTSDFLQRKDVLLQRWNQMTHRVEFLGRSHRGAMLWVIPRSVNRTDATATPVPMMMMQLPPTSTPNGAVGWASLHTQEQARPLLGTVIHANKDPELFEKVSHVLTTMLRDAENVQDPSWHRLYAGCTKGHGTNGLGDRLAAEKFLRSAQRRAINQLRPPQDHFELGCSVSLWSLKEKAKALVWALPPNAFLPGEWSVNRRAAMMQSLDAVEASSHVETPTTPGGDLDNGSQWTDDGLWNEIDEQHPNGFVGTRVAAAQARKRRQRVHELRRRKYDAKSVVSRLCPGIAGAAAQVLQIIMETLGSMKEEAVEEWYEPRPRNARSGVAMLTNYTTNDAPFGELRKTLGTSGTVATAALELYRLDSAIRYSDMLHQRAPSSYYYEDDPETADRERNSFVRISQLLMARQREKRNLLSIARPDLNTHQLDVIARRIGGRSAAKERARFERKRKSLKPLDHGKTAVKKAG